MSLPGALPTSHGHRVVTSSDSTVNGMNVPTTEPAPDWLRELTAARTHYEQLLGWPAEVQVPQRRLTVPAGMALDALTMPAPLGDSVLAELRITLLAGPVTADPGGTWWTFLSQPATTPRLDIPAALRRLRVRPTPQGTPVIIPIHPGGNGARGWRWIRPPHPGQPLPPWSVVLGATRRVAAAARR